MNKRYMNKRYTKKIKKNNYMNLRLQIIRKELESLRKILHFLLNFNKPTAKIVVSCSQQLDEVIVKYEKVKATCKKVA